MLTSLEDLEEKTENNEYMTFLEATVELIENMVEARWLVSHRIMRPYLHSAWKEVRDRYRSEQENIKDYIGKNIGELERHGLRGDQWEAKYSGFKFAYWRLFYGGGLSALKRLLKWINNILSSMAAALPKLDFLKEMKDLVEAVMDDTLDAGHWM